MLECARLMMEQIRVQLNFSLLPTDQLVAQLCKDHSFHTLVFLTDCDTRCKSGEPFPSAWKASLKKQGNTSALAQEDIDILLAFGAALGTTDTQGQQSICALHCTMLEQNLATARENQKKYGKLYTTLGVIAGLAVVILFL